MFRFVLICSENKPEQIRRKHFNRANRNKSGHSRNKERKSEQMEENGKIGTDRGDPLLPTPVRAARGYPPASVLLKRGGCLRKCPTRCRRGSGCPKGVPRGFADCPEHSENTVWTLSFCTLRNSGPEEPWGNCLGHPRFQGHCRGHSRARRGLSDPCSCQVGGVARVRGDLTVSRIAQRNRNIKV